MAKQTTRDAALSRLFGNTSEGASGSQRSPKTQRVTPKEESLSSDDAAVQESTSKGVSAGPKNRQGGGEAKGAAPIRETEATATQSGYIGMGRYSRSDGIVERITPYVRPDQAEALRIAVARKNDPRGTDVSQIIQSLLDEAGYRG